MYNSSPSTADCNSTTNFWVRIENATGYPILVVQVRTHGIFGTYNREIEMNPFFNEFSLIDSWFTQKQRVYNNYEHILKVKIRIN